MNISFLNEAKRLHALGFGVHWLRPQSKVPVKSGWSGDGRDTIKELTKSYQRGYNIGTKLGKPSEIEDCFLAVIDVDVKGTDKRFTKEAKSWIEKHFPGLLASSPITHSGRGNGSMHVWCLVQNPIDSRKLTQSTETIEVMMPSVTASRHDKEKLGEKKIKQGWRLRPAWEVDFMCAGRQVVLPPSIHPDTGKAYKWGVPLESVDDLQIVTRSQVENVATVKNTKGRPKGGTIAKHEIVDVEESELELRLDPKVVDAIYTGDDVEDRSAYAMTVALNMVKAKFTDGEILGVLTNKKFFIGECAFSHAKTSNRNRAARWAYDYCIRKARQEADAAYEFDCEVEIYPTLSPEKAETQTKAIVTDLGRVDWKKKLDRTDKDAVKPTFKNVKLIIENAVGKNTFIYNEFSRTQQYGLTTPWGGILGKHIEDIDEVRIKDWFSTHWKIEPHTQLIGEVIAQIATANSTHPVREYLETLEWDGVPRVNTWLQLYLGAEGEPAYLEAVSRKFLVAAVARVYNPGVKFDHMPILEGLQGKGKSTVGRILAGEKWFYDSELNLHDKDSALNLQGQWIVEMGELANINRADVRTIKSFITRQVDKVRPPYGKRMIESARQCVFFGTTNDDSYLKDKTGNRRFWPVNIPDHAEIDLEGLIEDRDQLWAEACMLYDLGELLYLEKDIEAVAKVVQESRVVEDVTDVMLDQLATWKKSVLKARKAKKAAGDEVGTFRFKLVDLFGEFSSDDLGMNIQPPLKDYKSDNNLHLQFAASCLKKLEFQKYIVSGRSWWRLG